MVVSLYSSTSISMLRLASSIDFLYSTELFIITSRVLESHNHVSTANILINPFAKFVVKLQPRRFA